MTETRGQYITDTMPWLEIRPEPKVIPQEYYRAQALLDQVLDDLRSWCSAHEYGDCAARFEADEQLLASASRLFGHLEGLRDDL